MIVGSLHARRMADKIVREKPVLSKLFEVLGPRYQDREGGYTRVMQLARRRQGDNAPMAIIEYIDRPGEIRAARPPPARLARAMVAANPPQISSEQADQLTADQDDSPKK
jgi:large subunit ribosomal protein L17